MTVPDDTGSNVAPSESITLESVSTSGNGGVSGGQASYRLPIMVPPGRNKLQPDVSLSYSSQGGNGVAGVGWSVNAGSGISRCGASYAVDGLTRAVTFDASSDRLCLDGQRLIADSGVYGASGTTYRTEMDSFVRVTQHGGINSSSTSFTVEYANGSTSQYGDNSNSRFIPSGLATALNWKISKKTDSSGNTIEYRYDTSVAGEHLLSHIYYTGTSGTRGERFVEFVYEARDDKRFGYIAGGKTASTRRLKQINTHHSIDKPVYQYQLTYTTSRGSQRSLLTMAKQCAFDSNGSLHCSQPLNFDWFDTQVVDSTPELVDFAGLGYVYGEDELRLIEPVGDVNGDGTPDWPGVFANAEMELISEHSKPIATCHYQFLSASNTCIAADVDSDGKVDVHRIAGGSLQFYMSNSQSWFNTHIPIDSLTQGIGGHKSDQIRQAADFNGDGLPDLLIYFYGNGRDRVLYIYPHSGSVSSPYSASNRYLLFSSFDTHLEGDEWQQRRAIEAVGDIDGNGLIDFMVSRTHDSYFGYTPHAPQYFLLNKSSGGFSFHSMSTPDLPHRVFGTVLIDVNGDGLKDWVNFSGDINANQGWYIRLNKGDGSFGDSSYIGSTSLLPLGLLFSGGNGTEPRDFYYIARQRSFKVADIDNDGIQELLYPQEVLTKGCMRFNGSYERCGLAIHSPTSSQTTPFMTQMFDGAQDDQSLYRFKVIKFEVEGNSVSTSKSDSEYIGTFGTSSLTDANGDGLLDMVFPYGADTSGVWLVDPENGPLGTNYGLYIQRGYGAGSGFSASDYQPTDYLSKVTDGLGNTSQWRYRPLSTGESSAGEDKLYHTDHSYVGEGYVHFGSSMYVAQSFKQSNGQGGLNETQYAYKGAMYNLQGRGFTGFRETIERDMQRGKTVRTQFEQKFPEIGLPVKQTVKVDNLVTPIVSTTYTWADNPAHTISGVFHNIRTSASTVSHDLDGTLMSKTLVTVSPSAVDAYGNIGERVSKVTDYPDGQSGITYVTKVNSTYDPQSSNSDWWPNKVSSVTTTTTVESRHWGSNMGAVDVSQWQKQTFVWDINHKKPQSVTYSGSDTNSTRTESRVYNDYGLPSSVTVSGTGLSASRTTSFIYTKDGTNQADDGYLPYKFTNALGHVSKTEYDMSLGLPVKVTDPNGLITETFYDPVGRPVEIRQTGQPHQYLRYLLASNGNHAPDGHAKTLVRTTGAGMPTAEVYFDARGRELRTATQSFDGGYIYLDKSYDALGRLTAESQPYDAGGSGDSTRFGGFDALDRPGYRILPNGYSGLRSDYRYEGQTTHIRVGSLTMSRTYGAKGLLYQTIDAKDGSNRFAYDAAARPLVIEDANNNRIVASYNALGHKTKVVDPNQGTTNFVYNTLGELTSQTDANGVTQTFTPDKLGRVKTKVTSGSSSNGTATYTWDTLKKGLLSTEVENGISRSYQYDTFARLTRSSVTVDGTTRHINHQYDGFYGRPKGLQYPNGLTLAYGYNDTGYLEKVSNAASGYVYRQITQMDAQGHITGAQLADGVMSESRAYSDEGNMRNVEVSGPLGLIHAHYYDTYDEFMNLIDERNGVTGLSKNYQYDELQRLKQYTFAGTDPQQTPFSATVNYDYDAVGNLLKKTDYSANKANAYKYGSQCSGNSKPNAVCQVEKLSGQLVGFTYDNRGNLQTGDGLTTTYNALDKPLQINGRGANTQFVYGSDNMRAKQTRTVNGATTTTYYVDKLYEADSDGSWRAYIADAAVISYTPEQAHKILFTLKDRLGSGTTLADQSGTVVSRRYFDPFGRTANLGADHRLDMLNGNTALSRWTDLGETNRHRRGFTDHEHLNEQQLIHMNGRVYDYNLGRFMSVDPLIQSPTSTQSVNPYSYIMNNPLAGTDPTGYTGCAASRIESKCDTTLSQHGGNGKADASFGGGNKKGSGVSIKSNGNNSYTASFQLNKNTTLEVDFKVSKVGGLGEKAAQGWGDSLDPMASETDGMKFLPGQYGLINDHGGDWRLRPGGGSLEQDQQIRAEASKWAGAAGGTMLAGGLISLYVGAEFTSLVFVVASGGDVESLATLRLPGVTKSTLQYANKISKQKQMRHVKGTAPANKSYFDSLDDAQSVLDNFNAGNYKLISENVKQSTVTIQVENVTGRYVNVGNPNGLPDVNTATNVFMIQSLKSPKIVPVNPNKGL